MSQTSASATYWQSFPSLPLLSKLLSDVFAAQGGAELLYGSKTPDRIQVSVMQIRFTQDSVAGKFAHGKFKDYLVADMAQTLRDGKMKPSDFPLAVVKFDKWYWTLNNRSLYVLRLASDAQHPLMASVATYDLCAVTSKFIQLRCDSLISQNGGVDEQVPQDDELDLAEQSEDGEELPEYNQEDEDLLEEGIIQFHTVPT
eukprot:TRINITY_DN24842_c0_g1_i1.p1 TRINITY_DN24842_c0_g1~~TRINITY_DN24842_c0_g1_i1.p1  ORF type:complete len:224 (-),score=49.72 TRINITY_DN24842_c0_g1_i1:210-809(-)